ncbi:hypothetical protein FBUS_00216 [Fasciolopsis buskii]|uniref:Uncharacterized protein n=1 Tax=Fasciolopsis buskii TaxID=27845 RepID=A0A8E0RVW3_9TREM|nr:hypothetical protein FBUS_00216 [Fasciolopsis buski]
MCSPIFFRGRELKYYRAHYYPEERTHMWEFMKEALGLVIRSQDTKTRLLIVPNGSYRICGRIMAAAYSHLCPEEIKRIFVFGQTEQFLPFMCGLSSCDYLDTPLGKLQVDKEGLF